MYVSSFDVPSCSLVGWKFSGDAEHEWQQIYDDVLLLDSEATRQNLDSLLILGVEEDSGRPNPNWRKKFASVRNISKARKRHSVFIMNSALLRGALMAINWIVPPPPHEEIFVCKTFEEAVAWAEEKRKQKLPILLSLKAQVFRKAEKHSQE